MKLLSSWKTGRAAVALVSLSLHISSLFQLSSRYSTMPLPRPLGHLRPASPATSSTSSTSLLAVSSPPLSLMYIHIHTHTHTVRCCANRPRASGRSKLFDVLFTWSLDKPSSSGKRQAGLFATVGYSQRNRRQF